MKNKTWKNYLGAAALITVLFAGSVSAYFTDQDEKVNTFTVGKVTIELEEPKWEKNRMITAIRFRMKQSV